MIVYYLVGYNKKLSLLINASFASCNSISKAWAVPVGSVLPSVGVFFSARTEDAPDTTSRLKRVTSACRRSFSCRSLLSAEAGFGKPEGDGNSAQSSSRAPSELRGECGDDES